jgi:hypothetical protein
MLRVLSSVKDSSFSHSALSCSRPPTFFSRTAMLSSKYTIVMKCKVSIVLNPQYESELTKVFFDLKYCYVTSDEYVKIVRTSLHLLIKTYGTLLLLLFLLLLPLLTPITGPYRKYLLNTERFFLILATALQSNVGVSLSDTGIL